MPPKENKKKAKKKPKAPAYLTGEADLAPFGVQVNQLVHNVLGLLGSVLGVKTDATGTPRLWVHYVASGLVAPLDSGGLLTAAGGGPGFTVASHAAHIERTVADLQRERVDLDAKWQAYNAEQAVLRAAMDKKKPKTKKPPAAGEQQQGQEGTAVVPAAGAGAGAPAGEVELQVEAAAASTAGDNIDLQHTA